MSEQNQVIRREIVHCAFWSNINIMNQIQLKKELKRLFKSMDFVSDNFLNGNIVNKKEFNVYFNIYQQLGLAWEFLGLHCKHREGYKKIKDKKEACKVCGKIKDVEETYYLLPKV